MFGLKITGQANIWQIITSAAMVVTVIGGGYWALFEYSQQGKDLQRDVAALTKKIDEGTIAQTKALADARTDQTKALADQAVAIAAQNADLRSDVSKLDGKLEAYGASQQALGSRVDRLSDKVDRVVEDQKGDRQDRVQFQAESERHVNAVDARVRVLECMRGGKC